jgi:hypothetical protein
MSGCKVSRGRARAEEPVGDADRTEIESLKSAKRSYSDALNEREQCSDISDRRGRDRDNGS